MFDGISNVFVSVLCFVVSRDVCLLFADVCRYVCVDVLGCVVVWCYALSQPTSQLHQPHMERERRCTGGSTPTPTPAGGWPPAGGAHRRRVGSYRVH